MKRAKILILDLNPSDCLGNDLRSIIESQFDVEEVKIREKIDANATLECGKKLAEVIPRSNCSAVFVVQSADRLKQTRGLFHSPEIEIPANSRRIAGNVAPAIILQAITISLGRSPQA